MANVLHLHHLHLLGDSKVIIKWLQRKVKLHASKIEGWKRRVQDLQKNFQGTYFQHIYRETNKADSLSKRALEAPMGILVYFTWINGFEGPQQTINFFKRKQKKKKKKRE
jgi:hypothetical protein